MKHRKMRLILNAAPAPQVTLAACDGSADSYKSSPVYVEAMKAAQSDARVVEVLGTPIQASSPIYGAIKTQGLSGDASFTIPISGPHGSGTLYASAREENGVWQSTRWPSKSTDRIKSLP